MTNAQITLFIAKSLSISLSSKNLEEIKKVLKSKKIDWDLFVKISTTQLVLPALYCNYKRNNLLPFLPEDLVAFMQEVTSLNRDRNLQIIEQINELNSLLKKNGVNPIFIKGAGNLLQNLYDDPAERMIGDIDFLVSNNEFDLATKILTNNNFKSIYDYNYDLPIFMHYPRLYSDDHIAAVEIHQEMVIEKYASEFNYETIKYNIIHNNGYSLLSYHDQKALCIFSNQINDYGFDYKTIGLKNAYDFLLLNSIESGNDFAFRFNKLKTPIMCFVGQVEYLVENTGLILENDKKIIDYLKKFKILFYNPKKRKFYSKIIFFKLSILKKINILSKFLFNNQYRTLTIRKISDKRWQREKLVQLKLKKPIKN